MMNGKTLVLYDGYTFYKRYKLKKFNKWNCTSFPKCNSYINIDDNMTILGAIVDHSHKRRRIVKTSNGSYTRI